MTGLEREIANIHNRTISINKMAKYFDKTVVTIWNKVHKNTFTVSEALLIIKHYYPDKENNYDFFKYLFTDDGEQYKSKRQENLENRLLQAQQRLSNL